MIDGNESQYNHKNALDVFLILINNKGLKHFYGFFKIIRCNDHESLGIVLTYFLSIFEDKKYFRKLKFLTLQCLKRGFFDLIESHVHSLIDYYEIGLMIICKRNVIYRIKLAIKYFTKATDEGIGEAENALDTIYDKHPKLFT